MGWKKWIVIKVIIVKGRIEAWARLLRIYVTINMALGLQNGIGLTYTYMGSCLKGQRGYYS